jgi:hypothetical protein
MSAEEGVEIRSYRGVFDLERRVYRIDRLRLNPGGVPVRGLVYWLAATLGVLLIGSLPVVGGAEAVVPWYVRDLALPAAIAALLAVVRMDGRPSHLAGLALARYALGPRRLSGLEPYRRPGGRDCWRPPDLLLLPDGSDARMRRLRFRGAGAALIGIAHECRAHRRLSGAEGLTIRECGGGAALSRGRVLELELRSVLDVRP